MYKISVIPNEKIKNVSKSLYGLFFEDINRAGDGGLYAELLQTEPLRMELSQRAVPMTKITGL